MRMDFNILWVDDQIAAVESTRDRIEMLIRKEGFRLKVINSVSIDEAKKYLSDDIYGDHIDLILMDFDLGAGGRGDQGLVEVRKLFLFKDIVFYSSQATDLLELVASKKIQGVFCSGRDELADTVDGVFEALVKKVLDIDHSRGIVMGATSDIDHCINDCLDVIFSIDGDLAHQTVFDVVRVQTENKRKNFEKDIAKVESARDISELMKLHRVYTSNDRLKLLEKMLEGQDIHKISFDAIKRYKNEVIQIRNDLAHVRVFVNGFSRKLLDRNDVELTAEKMKSLRQELLEYQDIFEELSEKLQLFSLQVD